MPLFALLAFPLMPVLLAGMASAFVAFDPTLTPTDITTFGKLDLAIGLCWTPLAPASRPRIYQKRRRHY